MPDGSMKKPDTKKVKKENKKPKTVPSKEEKKEKAQEVKSRQDENTFSVEELNISSGELKFENIEINNSTSYEMDTKELLESLGCGNTPVIPVLNKWDMVDQQQGVVMSVGNSVRISAKNGTGIDKLLQAVEDNLPVKIKRVKLLIPFDKGGLVADIRNKKTLTK